MALVAGGAGCVVAPVGLREGAAVHVGEQARLRGPHVAGDRIPAAGSQGEPFGFVPRALQIARDRGEGAEELVRVHRHVDALQAQARLPPARVGFRVDGHVARHVLLPGLEVVHNGEHARALGIARPVQPMRVAGEPVVATGQHRRIGVHLLHGQQRVPPVGVVEVGSLEVVGVEAAVQGAVVLLVVEEVEKRPPRLAPARAPAHLHHVTLGAVGNGDVEVLGAFGDAWVADVAPAACDPVEAEAVDAVVEVAVEVRVAGGEGGEGGEEGGPGGGPARGVRGWPYRACEPGTELHPEREGISVVHGQREGHRDPDPADVVGGQGDNDVVVGRKAVNSVNPPFRKRREPPHGGRPALRWNDPSPGRGTRCEDLRSHRQLPPGPIGHLP